MVKFTGGILRSATHRVVNPPGENQSRLTRQSLVYFSRPNDDVPMKILKHKGSQVIDAAAAERELKGEADEEINAKDWILRRALSSRGAKGNSLEQFDGTEVKGSWV